MAALPVHLGRVPTLLSSRMVLSNLTRSNLALVGLQAQLSSGRAINSPSDDPVRASAIGVLDEKLAIAGQRGRNLDHASSVLNQLDAALGEAGEMVLEARSLASSQLGTGSDAETRRSQAIVVDSMVRELFDLANRQTSGLYLFGGSTPSTPPVVQTNLGYRYVARGDGLRTDIGSVDQIPITLGSSSGIGDTSVRIVSTADLDPALDLATPVSALNGARGLGVTLGPVRFSFTGGPEGEADLTGAETAGDIVTRLTNAIRDYEAANGVTILGPGGVGVSGSSIRIDVVAGGPPTPALTFRDPGTGGTAKDLGLDAAPFTDTNGTGTGLDPRLTLLTPLSSIGSLTLPLGSIRLKFTRGESVSIADVDLSDARTIDDIRDRIERTGIGVRVRIGAGGRGIDLLSEVSGPSFSVEEVPGSGLTATQLGIRSFDTVTRIADFNNGRGVRVVDGAVNPETGQVDPALNTDFEVRLGNGQAFTVDLRPQDMATVQTVLDRINSQAQDAVAAGQIPAGAFAAGLTDGANGIAFRDLAGLGPISVSKRNNSPAAQELGLLDGRYDAPSATFVAQDRATVRVDNLFTHLIALGDALRTDDQPGIALAGEDVERSVDRLSGSRALVGFSAQRVEQARERLDDTTVLDTKLKSELQDLDFTDAAVRYSLLQTQLNAGLQSAAQFQARSLLDFLR